MMLTSGSRFVPVDMGDWFAISQGHHTAATETLSPPAAPSHGDLSGHFHFHLKFVFDRLSVPFVVLTFLLCGTIAAFANKYLHREPGFNRFFVLYSLFLLGMVTASLAGTIETLFAGWELVGVSSALLVAFFQERSSPVKNGLHVWIVYRISDAALLLAAVVLHHLSGEGDFSGLLGAGSWPEGNAAVSSTQAFIVGLLILVAAAGKSGLIPFSGWLPRAMEGPTPSSAVFYGALSVHLGAFLLLRMSPLLERSLLLCALVVVLGVTTALFASAAARAQADIKSALSFSSLAQVGIIVAEIGLGLRYLALVHILGHACLRTLQFLRASSVLQDYRMLENAIGDRLPAPLDWSSEASSRWSLLRYQVAFHRGFFDSLLARLVVRPFLAVFQRCDALERRWTDFLCHGQSRESDGLSPAAGTVEELG
jgi:NADH-quinone oxidoreductase subunit L